MKERKTKVGKLLQTISTSLPDLAGDVMEVMISPNPAGAAVGKLMEKLNGPDAGDLGGELLAALKATSPAEWREFQLKEYEIEVRDRDSARNREIKVAESGKADWMMYLVGIVGLVSFAVMVYAVIWIPGVENNKLFVHLMGIIEGVVIGNIFAYYYGTSKSSADKTKMLR